MTTLAGHYHVTNNFSDRTFASVLTNTWFANGWALHGEANYVNREETAGLFVGGASFNTHPFSIKGLLGTSTVNESILPSFLARLETSFRTDPSQGLVVTPGVTYRDYRNGVHETTVDGVLSKYFSVGPRGSLIASAIGRTAFISNGDHVAPAFGGSLLYTEYKSYALGVTVEAGRASYDAVVGLGFVDEKFISYRPIASAYLSDKLELSVTGEYTDRESHKIYGGFVGLKVYLD